MSRRVHNAFLARQLTNGTAFAADSPLVDIVPSPGLTPDRYLATFHARTLIREPGGEVREAEGCTVSIWFPPDYLRKVNQAEIITWTGPASAFHPNTIVAPDGRGYVCLGTVRPGTPLVELLERLHDLIRFASVCMNEADALNWDACQWARSHREKFPIDARSPAGTVFDLEVVDVSDGRGDDRDDRHNLADQEPDNDPDVVPGPETTH